jgi:apolipoprotein N-acyltransferase
MTQELLTAINFFICSLGGFCCICRLRIMGTSTKKPIRFQYAIWFAVFFYSAFSWTYGDHPTGIQIVLGAAVLAHILLGFSAWRDGLPKYAKKEEAQWN